jgi:hypothetical protein
MTTSGKSAVKKNEANDSRRKRALAVRVARKLKAWRKQR